MENALNSEGSLMHYKGHPSDNLLQLFLKCKEDQKETVAITTKG